MQRLEKILKRLNKIMLYVLIFLAVFAGALYLSHKYYDQKTLQTEEEIRADKTGYSVLEKYIYKNKYRYDDLKAGSTETIKDKKYTHTIKVVGEITPNIKLLKNQVAWIQGNNSNINKITVYIHMKKSDD